jgi:phage terminase Nu1 subunit (DNA packaging protein)
MGSQKKVSRNCKSQHTAAPMKIDTQCVVVDKQGLSSHLDVSMSTINRWIHQGMPYIERGGFGRPWKFNVSVVRLWKMRNKK